MSRRLQMFPACVGGQTKRQPKMCSVFLAGLEPPCLLPQTPASATTARRDAKMLRAWLQLAAVGSRCAFGAKQELVSPYSSHPRSESGHLIVTRSDRPALCQKGNCHSSSSQRLPVLREAPPEMPPPAKEEETGNDDGRMWPAARKEREGKGSW